MNSTKTQSEFLRDLPQSAQKEDADAAVWAGLLGEFLGPENDVYSRLLERDGVTSSKY